MTAPLPEMGQDPSVTQAQQVRDQFTATAQQTRQDNRLSDLQVAQQITEAWNSSNAQLSSLFEDLQSRRRARLAALEEVVPLGPAIPSDASQADVAVLQQAFRTALAQARNAVPTQPSSTDLAAISTDRGSLDAMLEDAEKFDDDNLRRAVLTAAVEAGHMRLVRKWTDLMGVTAQLDEYTELQTAIAGRGIYSSWNYTTFAPIPAPSEVAELPRLQAAQESAARVRSASGGARGRGILS